MKINRIPTLKLALLVLGLACLTTQASHAQLVFHVDLDTAALTSTDGSPYSLDFTLTYGGTLSGPTTVNISNFSFTGGSATGSTTITNQASGSMGSNILLSDSNGNAVNDIFQGFTDGTTHIGFDVSLSPNFSGLTPDFFEISILDNGNEPLWTTSPDDAQAALVSVTVDSANASQLTVGAFQSMDPSPLGVTASVSAIPEPSAWAMVFVGAVLFVGMRFRLRKA